MLNELSSGHCVAGAKQVNRALAGGRAKKLFTAEDADPRITEPLMKLASELGVPAEKVPTMRALGAACGISVGSAAAAVV